MHEAKSCYGRRAADTREVDRRHVFRFQTEFAFPHFRTAGRNHGPRVLQSLEAAGKEAGGGARQGAGVQGAQLPQHAPRPRVCALDPQAGASPSASGLMLPTVKISISGLVDSYHSTPRGPESARSTPNQVTCCLILVSL